jgi:hypothetical protein
MSTSQAASVDGTQRRGLTAGPLSLSAAGLAAAVVIWLILSRAYPFFATPQTAATDSPFPPGDAALAEVTALRTATRLKNAATAGLLVGALAGFAFAATEAAAQRRVVRAAVLLPVAVLISAALGALAGYAAKKFHGACEHDVSMDAMVRVAATQVIFWAIAAGGVGIGLGLLAPCIAAAVAAPLRAMLGALLFVAAYLPLASLLFPLDDAERIVPSSTGNVALWSVAALGLMGLMLGSGLARRSKPVEDSPG